MKTLSIVAPSASRIADGIKTIEVRSWLPNLDPNEDLLIVENKKFLRLEGETDDGMAVAIVKVDSVREYTEADIPAACASSWAPGYYSWILKDVRKLAKPFPITAARGIYDVELEPQDICNL